MSGTKARTTDGGTTGTNQTRHDASTAAERLDGPLDDEQSPDTASDADTDVGHRADSTAGEGERTPDPATEAQTNAQERHPEPLAAGDTGIGTYRTEMV